MEQRAVMISSPIDERMIEACQTGDRDAFRLLFDAYKDRVYSISLYYFKGDQATARDVTQQVFLKLLTRIQQFRREAEFTTWLYRFVVNACMDEQRGRRRFVPFMVEKFDAGSNGHQKNGHEEFARIEISDAVRDAIGELKPKLRMPILLKYVEGLSYDEMSEVLNCSKGTIASRLNRGHKILARRLQHLRGAQFTGD
jgi:RNA polymerase sigma-70 factor (ECF subfamily)